MPYEDQLRRIVRAAPPLMAALAAVRSLGLQDWCIGAGAVRAAVWDALHGYAAPSMVDDIDVVHFERAAQVSDAELAARLSALLPGPRWEVTNQATVHEWLPGVPFASTEEGIASWPEFATCVGIRLEAGDALSIIAPHGLDDLFGLRVRRNPARVSEATYRERVASKRFAARWPLLDVA